MPRQPHHSANYGGSRPGAGRPRGSLSKQTQVAFDLIAGATTHPLEVLLQIANSADVPVNVRAQAASSCLPYCVSRLGAAEAESPDPTDEMDMGELEAHVAMLNRRVAECSPDVIDAELIEVNG
jgi:hypothetical protein